MEQKMKFILIGLVGALAISVFFIFQFFTKAETLTKERDVLLGENDSLRRKAEESLQKVRGLEDKLTSLNQEMDKVTQEKKDLEKKFDLVNKEKQELVERLKVKPFVPAGEQKAEKKEAAEALPPNVDAYWAGILKAKTDLEIQLSSLRNQLKDTQIANEQMQRDRSALDLDMKSLLREKEDLKRQLAYNQKMLDSISQELVREKNDKIQIEDDLKPIKNENVQLRKQLASLNTQKINLEKRLQRIKEEKQDLEGSMEKMGASLKEKVSRITELKEEIEEAPAREESVELPPIVVRPSEASPSGTTLAQEGSILAINRDNNFVIINLGEDAGLKVGDFLETFRDGKSIGNLEVIQTRKNIAACDIKQEAAPFKIGDVVK